MTLQSTREALDVLDTQDDPARAFALSFRPPQKAAPEPAPPAAVVDPGHPLDLRSLAAMRAPEKFWFRPGWLGAGPTVLAAKGGMSKSTLVQHEATCGALGRAYFTPEGPSYRSVVWNCEDEHDDMWRGQERISEHEGIAIDAPADNLFLVSRRGCDNALMVENRRDRLLIRTPLFKELREQVNDLNIDVLWLDNAAHVFLGDHDDRTQVTQFINELNGLVRGRPFGVVIVLHISKVQGSEFGGSVAWENAARMRWYMGSKLPDQQDDGAGDMAVRYLAKRKANHTALDHVRFTVRDGGILVPDQAPSHVSGIVTALTDQRAEQICLAGFKTLCGMGIRTTDGKSSPDYLPSQMVSKGLAAGFANGELGRAMNRLMGRGVFVRDVVGQHSNRSPKFGLVLKEEAA